MNPADIQLRLELPGLGVNSPMLLSNMTFDSPNFTSGAHLEAVRGSGIDVMSVELSNPFPVNGFFIANPGTQVLWWPSRQHPAHGWPYDAGRPVSTRPTNGS